MILHLLIYFSFMMYCLCEVLKYKSVSFIERLKGKPRQLNAPICYVKLFFLVVSMILITINRFTDGGILERSTGIKGFLLYLVPMCLFLFISILDVRTVWRKSKIS